MLFDVIIRFLAALGLIITINAKGITTVSVVMSICIFLFLEISLLPKDRKVIWIVSVIPFIGTLIVLYKQGMLNYQSLILTGILAGFTAISSFQYYQLNKFKDRLIRTMDDSKELESLLESKNKRLLLEQDQQVHLATLAERNRIAREIHDNVGHMLSRAILLLGAINTVNTDEKLEPQLKLLADTLDESMAKMRESVHDLHDDSIDVRKNFDEIISQLTGFTVNTDLDLDEALPTNVKLSLIGILKEAVTNILKHSNGNTVSIILQQNYSFCTLSIKDNGTVSDETKNMIETESYEGIGLSNIKNRARSVGGDAYFYSNDGFTVFARLPFGEQRG